MRILHTESSLGWGGQENRTLNELVTMRDRGHELAVVCRPGARLIDRAKELGFEFTLSDNEARKGVSRMASLEILLRVGGLAPGEKEKEEMAARKNRWYVEFITGMTPDEILPGSIRLLKQLRKEGILTAIGSASKNALTILDRIKITDMFDEQRLVIRRKFSSIVA